MIFRLRIGVNCQLSTLINRHCGHWRNAKELRTSEERFLKQFHREGQQAFTERRIKEIRLSELLLR